MTYLELIAYYKTDSRAAGAIGTDRQRVFNWRKSGIVPVDAQLEYEVESEGALRADVPQCIRDGKYRAEKTRRKVAPQAA